MGDTTVINSAEPTRIGRFPLKERLGKGGMGEVYRAWHPRLKVDVALKTILAQYSTDPYFQRKLQEEGEKQAQLKHAHILRMLDSDEVDGQWFLVTEFADGGSLRERLRSGLPAAAGLADVHKLAHALAHAHTRKNPVVHLDIKPENILYVEDEPKLADFGIARIVQGETVHSTRIAFDPRYAPPEQLDGHPQPASDVYSLGLVLREVVTGMVPKQSAAARCDPKDINPELPAALRSGLAELTTRCLSFAPEQRPTATELSEALDNLLTAGQPGHASRWVGVTVLVTALVFSSFLPAVRNQAAAAWYSLFPPQQQQVEFRLLPANARLWSGGWLDPANPIPRGSHRIAVTAPGYVGRVVPVEVPRPPGSAAVSVVLSQRPDTIDLEYLAFRQVGATQPDTALVGTDWQDPALRAAAAVLADPDPSRRKLTMAELSLLAEANDPIAVAALYLHAELSGQQPAEHLIQRLQRAAHMDDALTALIYAEYCSRRAAELAASSDAGPYQNCTVEYLQRARQHGMPETAAVLTADPA